MHNREYLESQFSIDVQRQGSSTQRGVHLHVGVGLTSAWSETGGKGFVSPVDAMASQELTYHSTHCSYKPHQRSRTLRNSHIQIKFTQPSNNSGKTTKKNSFTKLHLMGGDHPSSKETITLLITRLLTTRKGAWQG